MSYVLVMWLPGAPRSTQVAGPFSWAGLLQCVRVARVAGLACRGERYSYAVQLTIRELKGVG